MTVEGYFQSLIQILPESPSLDYSRNLLHCLDHSLSRRVRYQFLLQFQCPHLIPFQFLSQCRFQSLIQCHWARPVSP